MATSIYQTSPSVGNCLCQGEIISGLIRFHIDPAKIAEAEASLLKVDYPFAIVLTQMCDLRQDFDGLQTGKPAQLPNVLFCHAPTALQLRSQSAMNSTIWEKIKKNKDERYHFLEKTPADCDLAGEGIPELGVDFKRYFTIPTEEVYRQLDIGPTRRRAVLCTPYLEHLSNRFAYYLSRVGLPREHISE